MPLLPTHADLQQLRLQAKDLLASAKRGEEVAIARLHAVSDHVTLSTAQLALAREHGFTSWAQLKLEVERRAILDRADVAGLRDLLDRHPELAVRRMTGWRDHLHGTSPLSYVAMMRYDTTHDAWRDVPGTAALAQALLNAGAPVEGDPLDAETPLITAASYGDAGVACVLIDAGADLDATAQATAGGVPGTTALRHAVVFGMAEVIDVLLDAGATDLLHAARAGDLTGALSPETPEEDRVAALRIAAEHGQLHVIDVLIAASTPVDGVDRDGSTALHAAAYAGRADSVQRLLMHGADPARRDTRFDSTPLAWCRHQREQVGPGHGHDEVEAVLRPLTRPS